MDSHRFDRLTSQFARRLSRRQALASGGAAGLAALALGTAPRTLTAAQEATPEPEAVSDHPMFLFVQLFDQGTWTPHPEEPDTFLLTLTGSSAQTLFFSDRPDRIVGTAPTARFLEGLGFTPESPPNAALVARTPEDERDVLVLELFNPVYTQAYGTDGGVQLTYEARVLEAYTGEGLTPWAEQQEDFELPGQLRDISLFIDDCPDITNCIRFQQETYGRIRILVGSVPGGPYGRCWDWDQFNCLPCQNDVAYYSNLCNQTYDDCNGRCFVDSCWAGICP